MRAILSGRLVQLELAFYLRDVLPLSISFKFVNCLGEAVHSVVINVMEALPLPIF